MWFATAQKAYIMKIFNKFAHIDPLRLPTTPMEIPELFPIDKEEIL